MDAKFEELPTQRIVVECRNLMAGEFKALSFKEWVALAEERKLLVTFTQVNEWKVGEAKKVVPVEYTRFMLIEYPDKIPVAPGVAYSAETFFLSRVRSVARDGKAHMETTVDDWELETTKEVLSIGVVLTGSDFGARAIESGLIEAKDGSACNGSGDGWTRYIEYEKLSQMPPIYWPAIAP
jgi:hypothetical protein